VTWTVTLAPAARVPNAQLSVCCAGPPAGAIVQIGLVAAESAAIDQLTPVPAGSGSLRATFFAAPGPALPTVMVKPSGPPVLIVAASAVLLIGADPPRDVPTGGTDDAVHPGRPSVRYALDAGRPAP
jgi:hypothetical protein